MEIDCNIIEELCNEYSDIDIYVHVRSNISEKKLNSAVQNFPITDAKTVYMVYDGTIFGSCKTGIAICDNGVFYRNSKFYEPAYNHISWEEFMKAVIEIKEEYIYFGESDRAYVTVKKTREKLEELFKKIQEALLSSGREGTVIDANGWRVAIDNKQYGPLDTAEIIEEIQKGNINPSITYLWKQGMEQWELIANIKEFKDIVEKLDIEQIQAAKRQMSENSQSEKEEIFKVGSLNINSCTLEELLKLDCINLQKAKKVLELRKAGSKFYSAGDIGTALGLKPHEVEELKKVVVFNSPQTSTARVGRIVDY